MPKHQYIVRGSRDEELHTFANRILVTAAPSVMALGSFSLKVTLTDVPAPRLSVIPLTHEPLALLSLAGEELPEPSRLVEILRTGARGVTGYSVTEALPRAYERDWPDGRQTPGIGLLTLFRRRPGQDDETFLRYWHGGHTPLTLRTHPVWNYVRSVVDEPIVEGSPPLDGIVEEHFRDARDLLNPVRFFGGPLRMLPNMARVGLDIRRFIDLATIESYLVTEVHLRS
jgi:hypothetical protein